jgi:site-specific DNA-methyltransferase (adenine-specific)
MSMKQITTDDLWLSDYVPNRLGGFMTEQQPQKPAMELVGQDGNIFGIVGRAANLLRQTGQSAQAKEMTGRVFDAVITDPPYASGGRTQTEKNKSTAKKYSSMGDHAPPPFEGDAKDQRSWTRWAAAWLADARKLCKPGAPVCMFIDWRQLPAATDALQWAGWIWRGTAVWDKGNSRPQKGRFRQQAEYIVWGSNGDMPINRPVPCLPGVFKYGNPQNRIHLTEKPLQLMRDVVKITEPRGRILDPFAGSGTTVLAAVLEGYTATGIEVSEAYVKLARERIERELSVKSA